MDELRYILLILGIILLFGIYFSGRRQQRPENTNSDDSDYVPDSVDLSPETIARINSDVAINPPDNQSDDIPVAAAAPITASVNASLEQGIIDTAMPSSRHKVPAPSIENWRFRPIESEFISASKVGQREEIRTTNTTQKTPLKQPTPTKPAVDNSHNADGNDEGHSQHLNLEDSLLTVINVLALEGRSFAAHDVREVLDSLGLVYGDMRIYHYHANALTVTDNSPQQRVFSVANIKEPGCFDINDIDSYATTGLSLFMLLPGPIDGRLAFEKLISVANILAERLGGYLYDDNFNKITKQTLTHLQDTISEFGLHHLVDQS